MTVGIAQCLTCVVYLSRIQQPAENGFVGLEDGAVLVKVGNGGLVADILEGHKILREMSTEIFELITVVVDEPT